MKSRLLTATTGLALFAGLLTISPSAAPLRSADPVTVAAAACTPAPATPKRQVRAMWIATVVNIDWPSRTGLSAAAQQAEFRSWLDLAQARRLNTVIVQVRPTADTFWQSSYEPWSHWLTGTQGRSPGYDPLAFMVAEAHARNIELHAWFNPYRVANHTDPSRLVSSHPARRNPGWVFAYGGQLYYNPGIPAVRAHVQNVIMDAVNRYDIDGVHFDDYFYPYPSGGTPIPDQATYAQYGGGFANVNDWRRNNVNLLVQELDGRIHAAKPWVKFGIAPFGIWRNASTDPLGSATSGLQSYDAIYADTRRWVKQGWIDYIAPQVYWPIGFTVADYAELVPWWADVVAGTGVQLLIGQATYRAGAANQDQAWQDPAELSDHLLLNRNHPQVAGDIHFSAKDVRANRIGAVDRLAADHYTRPSLIPVIPSLGGAAPATPTITGASRNANGVTLTWQGNGTAFAVYRVNGTGPTDPCAFADARNLLGAVRGNTFTDTGALANTAYTYHVSALDRRHHESAPSVGRAVQGGTSGFSVVVDGPTAGGAWGTSSFSTQRHGTDYRFAEPVAASDPAWFTAELPSTGTYRVEVWHPADSGYNSATPHVVVTTGGNRAVTLDQRTGGGQWRSLGTFELAAGRRQVIGVSRWTSTAGYVVADAVRLTLV